MASASSPLDACLRGACPLPGACLAGACAAMEQMRLDTCEPDVFEDLMEECIFIYQQNITKVQRWTMLGRHEEQPAWNDLIFELRRSKDIAERLLAGYKGHDDHCVLRGILALVDRSVVGLTRRIMGVEDNMTIIGFM